MAKRKPMKETAAKMARIVRNIRASHIASNEINGGEALALNVAAYLLEHCTELQLAKAMHAVDNSSAKVEPGEASDATG